jgi:hypothetical protein
MIRDREQLAIATEYSRLVVTKLGAKPKRTRHVTSEELWRAFHAEIAKRAASGYAIEVEGTAVAAYEPRAFTSFPELERAVIADPHDDACWNVLADAWLDTNDPRGESVHAERALRGITDPDEFMARKHAIADARSLRATQLYGPLGADAHRVRVKFERGMVSAISLDAERCAPGRSTGELLALVLGNPFARFARSLELHELDGDRACSVFEQHHDAIREITVRTDELADLRTYSPRGLDRGFPQLASLSLTLRGGIESWDVELPELVQLRLLARLSNDVDRQIVGWACAHPELVELDVSDITGRPFALAGSPIAWPERLRAVRWNAHALEV